MAKRNRQSVFDTMRQPGARMIQIAREVEKHGGVLPQIIDPGIPSPTPIEKPEIDENYSKRNFELIKRITPGPLDTHFDHTTRFRTNSPIGGGTFTVAVGAEQLLWSYRVPAGQRLIIQQFLFFAEIDESPVVQYLVLAEPNEFFSMFDFIIRINGKTPGDITYATQNPNIRTDGWSVLTKDVNGDSNPNRGGIVLPANSRELVEVYFRNQTYTYASVYANNQTVRRVWTVGCRIRGFLSPVNPEEK